ncbi:MAG: L-threonine 3-dehydrogenase [Hyphomicrobiales bacterium]|nr:L-threonine 3-dehydrogenase [Hyphomicrobiales bacterium]
MRALVKAEPGPGLVMRDEPIPEIGIDDVLVKINKTAICGTDVHIWNWDEWARKTIPVPMVVGHEYVGEVVEIGSHVRRLKVGERVTGEGHLVSMRSRMSRAGRFHLDPETRGVGVNVPGAFAEYLRLPAFNAIRLPDEIDDELGAVMDPLGNAVHTALSFDLIGEDVLITGAGPIGIMAAAIARHVGARNVVITDVNSYRLALAGHIGDVVAVDVGKEDLPSVMSRLGMKEGFDVGFEMSGVSSAFDQMVDHMMMGGNIAMLGLPSGPTNVDWGKIIFKSLTIKAIYGREMFETWYKMIAMLQSGLDIRPVITHRFKIDEFENGFELMRSGKCGKVVLEW